MVIIDKNELRIHFLKLRSRLTQAEIEKKSNLICQKVLDFGEATDKSRFGVYLATKGEVDTRFLINKLVSQKKDIFLPRFNEVEKVYYFVRFSNWNDLEAGYFGIMQPKNSKKVDIKSLDVVFFPGLAFDKNGVRLGWGTGVYDKLLTGSEALKIGLAYDFQVAKSLPKEAHDIKVDLIVTEKRILKTGTI